MGKNKSKTKKMELMELRQNYLVAAISDISSSIHLMDEKVAIIMAAQGVIVAGLLSIYSDLMNSLKLYNSIIEKTILIVSVIGFISFMILVYVYGLKTITARCAKLSRTTSWFMTQDRIKNGFEDYLTEFNEKSKEELLDEVAVELFKLNDINLRKIKMTNRTIKMFSSSLLFLSIYFLSFVLVQI